jgi:CRISPR-associated endoribonuclease Cas6
VVPRGGVLKVRAVLQQPEFYTELMQAICWEISKHKTVEWQGKISEVTGVEVDSSSLHILQIPLRATDELPHTLGRAVHAQFFHWMGCGNAELAQELHQQENFPAALVLKPGKSPLQKYLTFGLLRPELVAPFLWGLSQDIGADIALTGIPCRLGKRWKLPTSFNQLQSCQPFPLPELVFGSLLRRWNVFAPTGLQFPAVELKLRAKLKENWKK